jgi:hypothetical protein
MHDQLPGLQLWPQSGGHLMPVNIFILGTVGFPRFCFLDDRIRKSMHQLPVLRHFQAAVRAGKHVTIGLTNGIRRKALQPLLGRRGNESIEFSAIDMPIQ